MKNQDIPNYCDASWAFSATSAVADRLRLKVTNTWQVPELATQVLINCADSYGCQGGTPNHAYKYMAEKGIPDETCLPYTGSEERCIDLNICRSCTDDGYCEPVYDYNLYYVTHYGQISGEEAMRREIYYNGPISCSIRLNSAFRSYSGGIFTNGRDAHGTHYITIIGWGEDDLPYWIARNSWGSYWGEFGFIRIYRGANVLGVEELCYWGTPTIVSHNTTSPTKPSQRSVLKNFVSCGYPTDWTQNKPVIKSPLPWTYLNVSSLPTTYDIRNLNGHNYATPNHNQHSPQFCNSCWAQAAASALSDRLLLRRKGKWPIIEVSAQVFLNCADGSCQGGDAASAYRYSYLYHVPDKTCQAYEGRKKTCDMQGICMDCDATGYCYHVNEYRTVAVQEYGEISGAEHMMAEIYARGPITCFIVMTDEFMNYEGGIFVEHNHNYKGGHIVEVAGWGVSSTGQWYWIVRNNWGEHWGERGWFRINMGGSNLLIETSCSWGVPSLD